MTREEELIAMLKTLKEQALKSCRDTAILDVKIDSFIFVIDEAIKAIEQQPCEDCISRKDVNVLVDELARAISDERCFISRGRSTASIMQDILDLPSVTPQPRTAHWILLDECSNSGYYCSECHKKVIKEGWSKTVKKIKYCPNCGAKMEGMHNANGEW